MEDDIPHRHGRTFVSEQLDDGASGRSRDLHRSLIRHDLDDGLVLFNGRALFDKPLDDLALGDALADVGELELDQLACRSRGSSSRSPSG